MNQQKVESEVIPLIEKLNDEQSALLANNSNYESLKNLPDNGVIREPNKEEGQLFEEFKSVDKALNLAKTLKTTTNMFPCGLNLNKSHAIKSIFN